MKQITSILLLTLVLASACSVSREQVGNYNEAKGKESEFKTGKDFYLFWDQVPIVRTEEKLKIDNYEIITYRRFFDTIIYYGSFGIFSFYDVEVKIKKTTK